VRLCNEPTQKKAVMPKEDEEKIKLEVRIAAEDSAFEEGIMKFGEFSSFACPECHGVLSRLKEGKNIRFRCHTGHAYSFESLLEALADGIESSLYKAIRGIEENIMLLNHIGDHFAETNHPKMAGRYFKKAAEAEKRVQVVRSALLLYEQSNTGILQAGREISDAGIAGEDNL
jgi:two-component system, chemotaxis family, protein-glutamate methylesterase/glutaminase